MERDSIEETISAIIDCMRASNHCFSKSLQEEDVLMVKECIRLTRECADVCTLALNALETDSAFAKPIGALCAQVCDTCAVECGRHLMDHCQQCADACLRCAEACRNLAAA
ncbi:four-helix bundle copper-binding protein [Exiguobacterium sp. ZOR0005]|uniref:four-helix bundle copper-binding protein n=1 Tax=Exiguobacterium sp. ZOR0005 TaxID=1339226 RepID=UPI00040CADA7|nr:four-helix bundle copper-binding protein [Exiguobacterium sp. ZOR0005]